MSGCTARLGGDPDGLRCTLDPHEGRGHRYESTSGVPDAEKEE